MAKKSRKKKGDLCWFFESGWWGIEKALRINWGLTKKECYEACKHLVTQTKTGAPIVEESSSTQTEKHDEKAK